jgi:hypothetical protein
MPRFLFIFENFYNAYTTFILSHSYSTFIRRNSLRFLSISSSLVSSVGKTSLGCRAEIELRPALQQANALATDLRRTLLTYSAPY